MTEPENEIDQFEDEEPNPERIEAIQQACNIFAQVSKLVPQIAPHDENDMNEIIEGILRRNGYLTDSMSYTLQWKAIREKRQEAARRECGGAPGAAQVYAGTLNAGGFVVADHTLTAQNSGPTATIITSIFTGAVSFTATAHVPVFATIGGIYCMATVNVTGVPNWTGA